MTKEQQQASDDPHACPSVVNKTLVFFTMMLFSVMLLPVMLLPVMLLSMSRCQDLSLRVLRRVCRMFSVRLCLNNSFRSIRRRTLMLVVA